jgi:transcriptional regulator
LYIPAKSEETRVEVMHRLIDQHPLGALVMTGAAGLDADHIPFEVCPPAPEAPRGILRAHVARANPLWKQDGAQALVLFQGPAAYVSPQCHGHEAGAMVVPTWDYAVVHAHGTLRVVEDRQWLVALLGRLTHRHESAQPVPWTMDDAPPAYIERLLKAVVGIEIVIERLQGKWKAG